jgi:predicted nucleotidyltransferase
MLLEVSIVEINLGTAIPYFKKYGVNKAAVFGSVARQEDGKESDIDIIVSFSKKYDLLELVGLKQDLEDAFHRPIDIITYNALKNDSFAQSVLSESKVIYEQN